MKKYKIWIILLNLIILIIFINWSILKKEKTIKEGVLALFELAPVDPRSLMQGDYMNLRYAMARGNYKKENPSRGYCVIRLNENSVASNVRFQENASPLEEGEFLVKYFKNKRRINLGAESYFFEEGTGERYEEAKYGGLRIDVFEWLLFLFHPSCLVQGTNLCVFQ